MQNYKKRNFCFLRPQSLVLCYGSPSRLIQLLMYTAEGTGGRGPLWTEFDPEDGSKWTSGGTWGPGEETSASFTKSWSKSSDSILRVTGHHQRSFYMRLDIKKLTFYKSYSACRVDYWLSESKTLAAGRPVWKFLQSSKWEMLHWNGEKGNLETWKNNVEQSKQTKNSCQTKHKDRGARTISEPPLHHHISTPVVSLRKVATFLLAEKANSIFMS